MTKIYIIPKGCKTIELLTEIEEILGVTIYYTQSGKSFARHQFNTLDEECKLNGYDKVQDL
jgi:hypothetical protein